MIALSESTTAGLIAAVASTLAATIAAAGLIIASHSRKRMNQRTDTGNDKPLGETVHDIAQTVEIVAAQNHTNTSELLTIQEHLTRHGKVLRDHIEQTEPLHAQMAKYLEDHK